MKVFDPITHSRVCRVSSETATLKKVIIHRPDEGIEMITPGSAVDLLYEDIVFLPKMREEHDKFTEAIGCFTGHENVLEVVDLLEDILKDEGLRQELTEKIGKLEGLDKSLQERISKLQPDLLAKILISGSLPEVRLNLFDPLPNFIFTRDTGVIINDHLLLSRFAKKPRYRESFICSYIYRYHPEFATVLKEDKIIDFSCHGTEMSIEGGDVMMLSANHLLVATSERTTVMAADKLIQTVFDKGIVGSVTRVDMPKMRACMHLDTIFTRVSKEFFVGYAPLTNAEGAMQITHHTAATNSKKYSSLQSLIEELIPEAEILPCADGEMPYAEREQWTDGCNLFAVRDGVAFTYDRNFRTNRALQKRGFSLISAEDFLNQVKEDLINPAELEHTIITIPSSELSRARGGPHCLTMPICRD